MKTPREILLERHESTAPKLDAIRREILDAEVKRAGPASRLTSTRLSARMATGCKSVLRVAWDELVIPSRRLWTGLAAVWLVILAANFSMRDRSQNVAEKAAPPTADLIMTWQQQERLLAELMRPEEPRVAVPPKRFSPQPRSERHLDIFIT